MTKRCPRCGETKPLSQFGSRKARPSETLHPQSFCDACHNRLGKEWRQNNRERYNASKRAAEKRRLQDPEYRERKRIQQREAKRRWLQDPANREKQRAANRAYRARRKKRFKQDPELHRRFLETVRANHHRRHPQAKAHPERWLFPDEPVVLDIAPFRAWLTERIEEEGVVSLARRVGLDEKTLRRYQTERNEIEDQVVDQILTAEGTTHLSQLYPELYRND